MKGIVFLTLYQSVNAFACLELKTLWNIMHTPNGIYISMLVYV